MTDNHIHLFTGRNEVVAKVMILLVCVILFTGEGLPQCMLGYHPLPPEGGTHPGKEAPPGRKHPPPRHTVNERPVRILLECILVLKLKQCKHANLAKFEYSEKTRVRDNQSRG